MRFLTSSGLKRSIFSFTSRQVTILLGMLDNGGRNFEYTENDDISTLTTRSVWVDELNIGEHMKKSSVPSPTLWIRSNSLAIASRCSITCFRFIMYHNIAKKSYSMSARVDLDDLIDSRSSFDSASDSLASIFRSDSSILSSLISSYSRSTVLLRQICLSSFRSYCIWVNGDLSSTIGTISTHLDKMT